MDHHLEANAVSGAKIAEVLTDLALDLRWSFNHAADKLWERLDPDLWDLTHNPWIVLQTASEEKLKSVTTDPRFQLLIADLRTEKLTIERSQGWFQEDFATLIRLESLAANRKALDKLDLRAPDV